MCLDIFQDNDDQNSGNKLGADGMKALLTGLTSSRVSHLNLSSLCFVSTYLLCDLPINLTENELGSAGAALLIEILPKMTSITDCLLSCLPR